MTTSSLTPKLSIEHHGTITLLKFIEALDAEQTPDLKKEIDTALNDNTQSFIVDMGGVDFLDSHGVGLFAILLKRAHERGGYLAFCALGDQPRSVLTMVGFNDLARFYDHTQEALKDLNNND